MMLVAGIWVKSLTGSDALATLALLCVYAPGVLSPWIGRFADSYRRRPLLIWTDLAVVPALAVLFFTDELWVIFVVLLLYGTKAVLVSAAEPALLVAMLPPDRLARVNGLRMSLQEGMKLIAPLAGAALFAAHGAWPVVAIDALSFLLAAGRDGDDQGRRTAMRLRASSRACRISKRSGGRSSGRRWRCSPPH